MIKVLKRYPACLLGVMVMVFSLLCYPNKGRTEVDVDTNLGVPPPAVMFPVPPSLVMITGTRVYFVPDSPVELFFYRGYWYRPYRGRWYRATNYEGAWYYIAPRAVPSAIIGLPPDCRHISPGRKRIPCGEIIRHWKDWEKAEKGSRKW